jgi:FkbM family methyltransferase
VLSGPLRGTRWVVGATIHSCWLGTFERSKLNLFKAALREGDVVYDIGAHVGTYSLLAAAHIGPTGRVYAFEPLPRNLGYLEQHLALNGVDNCTVLDVAVTSEIGTSVFDESVHPAMGHLGAAGGRVITVRTVTLDGLVGSGAIRPPSVVKLDIEGAEYDALLGATRTLADARPIVFVATHGDDLHHECCELLELAGFDLYGLDGVRVLQATEIVALPR